MILLFDHFSFYPSYVSVDYSSDVMAYSTTAYDYILDVASPTTTYCLYFQTTYDMANDIAIFLFGSSSRIPYRPTSIFYQPNPYARDRTDFCGTFVWTTFRTTSFVGFCDINTIDHPLYTTTVIHFACNALTSDASSTSCPFYTSNNELRFDDLPLCHTHVCGSHRTNILDSMANCSSSRTVSTTCTITKLTVPTTCSPTSTSGYHYINTSLNYSSTDSSKSSPKGSL